MAGDDQLKKFRIPHQFTLELVGYHDHTDELTAVFLNAYRAAIKMDEPIEIWVNEYKANVRRQVATMYPDGQIEDATQGNAELEEAVKTWEEMLNKKCGEGYDDDKQ